MNTLLRSIAWWAGEIADILYPVEVPFDKLAETAPDGEPTAEWPDDIWWSEQRAGRLDEDEIAAVRIMIEERFPRDSSAEEAPACESCGGHNILWHTIDCPVPLAEYHADSDSSTDEPAHAVPPLFPAHLREAGTAVRAWLAGEPPMVGDRAYWCAVADDLFDVADDPDAAEILSVLAEKLSPSK
jgi:hypothetical protein